MHGLDMHSGVLCCGGMCGGGMCGRGHAWHGGMCGMGMCVVGACGRERLPLPQTVCILLECILVHIYIS